MRPRLGFVGVGWIGRARLEAVVEADEADVVALCDPSDEAVEQATALVPGARRVPSYDTLLELDLDGVVLATPSAGHATQTAAALERGLAVFCQKPLGRSAEEVQGLVALARRVDRRLGVDMSYRGTEALRAVRDVVASGELGPVHALDLTFHNAYGPDKAWYRDPARSGGGCLMDLGIHLVDAALWLNPRSSVGGARATMFRQGRRWTGERDEDLAFAELDLSTGPEPGPLVRLACSWWLPAGRDADLRIEAYGAHGGVRLRNVDGSFFDFVAERTHGTRTEPLTDPPDAWGGRAACAWVQALARDPGFDPAVESAVTVADTLDRLYAAARGAPPG